MELFFAEEATLKKGRGMRSVQTVSRFIPGIVANCSFFFIIIIIPMKGKPLVSFRAIYTVRLCRMRQAYDRPTTRIVSCKSNLQLAYDCRVRHKKSRRILKHVLNPTTIVGIGNVE